MRKDNVEDIVYTLYIFPILINGVYGLWGLASNGADLHALQKVYSNLTREPIIFLAGLVAVCIAVVLDARHLGGKDGIEGRVSRLAYSCFASALVTALASTGFNIPSGISLFLEGRYALIYPIMLIVLGILVRVENLSISFRAVGRGLCLPLLLASPLALYLLWRLIMPWYLVFAVPSVLMLAAFASYLLAR